MDNDNFLKNALNERRLRPPRGSLWGELFQTDDVEQVEGVGRVRVTDRSSTGLVLVSLDDKETAVLDSYLFIVRALGTSPDPWTFRFLDREKRWEASWDQQRIEVGTVVAIRPIYGIGQDKTSPYKQLRWDEIVAIGCPTDEKDDMLPAPGWVLLRLDRHEEEVRESGLVLQASGIGARLEHGSIDWGTVVALPRGLEHEYDIAVSDRVGVPFHRGAGATEWLDFDGGLRAVPYDDLMLRRVE